MLQFFSLSVTAMLLSNSMEFAGCYFLTGKEETVPYNKLFCVFKMTYDITAYPYASDREGKLRSTDEHTTVEQEFYTACSLDNIIILEDGTCSVDLNDLKITSDVVGVTGNLANYYGYKIGDFYKFYGYSDIDSMFNKCIACYVSSYNYETTVK